MSAVAARLADGRLPRLLEGKDKPASARESLEFVYVCQRKRMYAAAARFSADAFAADPKLADDLNAAHRYKAAGSAALAATGQGEDAARLDDKERARLREQALDWLRGDLAVWSRQFAEGAVGSSRLTQVLTHWRKNADLAGLRDKAALAKLYANSARLTIRPNTSW